MKNMLTVSKVFDARDYFNSRTRVPEDFEFPYTFLLSQGMFLASPLALPNALTRVCMFDHGVGYATRKEAEMYRQEITEKIAEADLCSVVYRCTGVLRSEDIISCDLPSDAIVHIRKLDKCIDREALEFSEAYYKATNHQSGSLWVGPTLHLHFEMSRHHSIQIVQHIAASSEVPPLLDWDTIGIK